MIWAYVGAAALAIGFGTGWTVHDWKSDAEKTRAIEAAIKERDAAVAQADMIATRFETKLSKLRIVNRTIVNEVRRELEKTVYTDCVVPDSGVMLIRRSVSEANAAAGHVPGPMPPAAGSAAGKSNDGRPVRP